MAQYLRAALLALSIAVVGPLPATAGPLVGAEVNGKMSFQSGPGKVLDENVTIADPGVEFTFVGFNNATLSADLSATLITIGLFAGASTTIGDNLLWTLTLPSDVTLTGIGELSDNFPSGVNYTNFGPNMVSIRIPNQVYDANQTFTATFGLQLQSGSLLGVDANGKLFFQSLPNTVLDEDATVVDPGVEFTFFGFNNSFLSADLSDTLLTLQLFAGDSVQIGDDVLWTFTLPSNLTLRGIGELSDNFPNGVNLTNFGPNMVSIKMPNQLYDPNQTFTATFSLEFTEVAPVPEPGTLALVGIGLAGLAAARIHRSRKASSVAN